MNKTTLRSICCAGLLLAVSIFGLPARHTHASDTVTFTVNVGGAFLRTQPSLIAENTQPVFANQVYGVIGRTVDLIWVQLDAPKAGDGAWMLAAFGTPNGDLTTVPAIAYTPAIARAAAPAVLPGWIPAVTPRIRQLYQVSALLGRDPGMFTVVGDCNSESTAYLGRLAAGTFQLPAAQAYLKPVINRFSAAFPHASAATHGDFGTLAVFDPDWADPSQCRSGEGPLACELRISRASIAFIALGTGDQYVWGDFEKNYRAVIDYTLQTGALPVLVTKADNLETHSGAPDGAINDVIRRLGQEYGLPVMDFWAATRTLPGYGLRNEGNDNFHMTPAGSDMRILMTLQTLFAITRR